MSTPIVFATAKSLARRAGVHRGVVIRQTAQQIIIPDAFLELGAAGEQQPLFRADRAVEVLRHAKLQPRHRHATPIAA